MKTETFQIELQEGTFKRLSESEYDRLKKEAEEVFETVEEYADFVYMFRTVENGQSVWIGIL